MQKQKQEDVAFKKTKPKPMKWNEGEVKSILDQKIPINCGLVFRCFAWATKQSAEQLLARIFRTRSLDVPHAKGNMPTCNNDNIILVVNFMSFWFVYASIAQNSVGEAGRECCFTRVMNLAFEVWGEPHCNVWRLRQNFQVTFGRKRTALLDVEKRIGSAVVIRIFVEWARTYNF